MTSTISAGPHAIDYSDEPAGLDPLDDSMLELIIAALSLSDRARFERTCRRCRRMSREMIGREIASMTPARSPGPPYSIIARLDAGISISTIVGVMRSIIGDSLDVAATRGAARERDASGIIEFIVRGATLLAPNPGGRSAAIVAQHRRSALEIGVELYRFVLWHASSDHPTAIDRATRVRTATPWRIERTSTGAARWLPTALSVDWERTLGTSASDELAPFHDAALRGFCRIADSIEEYLKLVPSSALDMFDKSTNGLELVNTPTMNYIVDAFTARTLDMGSPGILDLSDRLVRRRGCHPCIHALIARLAIRIAESEGLSMSLIDIAVNMAGHMPPLVRFISVGGWWRRPLDLGLDRAPGANLTPGQLIGALLRKMSEERITSASARTVIDELAKITPFAAEYPSLSPMSLLAAMTQCVSSGSDPSRIGSTDLSWLFELIGEMFRYTPRGCIAPLASPEDAVGLLHVTCMTGMAMSMILRLDPMACAIDQHLRYGHRDHRVRAKLGHHCRSDSCAIAILPLACRYRWDPSATSTLCEYIAARSSAAPSGEDLIRYLSAIAGRTSPSGAASRSEDDHVFLRCIVEHIAHSDGLALPRIRIDEMEEIIDEYERRWPRTWHFGSM